MILESYEDVYIGEDDKKFSYFTNGEKTIKLYPGDKIPTGFYKGHTFNSHAWNKGLHKEDDERIAKGIQKSVDTRKANGSYISWNTGLTKDTDDRLKQISSKISATTKGRPSSTKGVAKSKEQKQKQSVAMKGREPWNKGLTKETDERIMQTSVKLTGHECFTVDWETAKQKEYATKKRNKSFNTSKPEKELIKYLIDKYGEDDVLHPYRDERYPFNCDVYIKSQDLFIELNGTIEHNDHPYDPSNPKDVEEANSIRQPAEKAGPKSRYWNIYRWWTEVDPKKLSTFRRNNLNFKIIYPKGLVISK